MTQPHDQLGLLLNALTEGPLNADQRAQLNALLRDDPALIDAYLDHLTLHSLLRAEHSMALPIALTETQTPATSSLPKPTLKPHPGRSVWYAAAALIAMALTAWFAINFKPQTQNHKPPSVAIATVTDVRGDVVFASDPLMPGDEIVAQTIRTSTGTVNLLLRSGASVNLNGPAEMQLISPMHVSVQRGQASFDCPHTATGFTVDMPDGSRVVDLGTRFDIDITGPRSTSVWVLEGAVEVQLPSGVRRRLVAGHEASLVGGMIEHVTAHQIDPVVTLEPTADTYVRLGEPETNFNNARDLVIKNAGSSATTRKGYLQFDIGAAHRFVHEAELKLQVRHNDSGGGDPTPNALQFTVFGLLDRDDAAPDFATLTWLNAPASVADSNALDPSRVVPLGSLNVPAHNASAEPVVVRLASRPLAQFIHNDRDGRITLIITRVDEDGGWNSSFHARESTTGLAPTLTLFNTPANSDLPSIDKEISR